MSQNFIDRYHKEATTPQVALHLWFEACFMYMDPSTRDEGRIAIQKLTIPLMETEHWDRKNGPWSYFVKALVEDQFIIRSYAKGTNPDNAYAMDPTNFE